MFFQIFCNEFQALKMTKLQFFDILGFFYLVPYVTFLSVSTRKATKSKKFLLAKYHNVCVERSMVELGCNFVYFLT